MRYKFELYKDPNDANDKGVYFHKFSDWWDNTNNQANTTSDYWYKHWYPNDTDPNKIWYPVYLKNTYSEHHENVVDVFFLDNTIVNDIGGASVSSLYGSIFGNSNTEAAFTCSDAYEGYNTGAAYAENWAHHVFHELGHTMDLWHTFGGDDCADTWDPSSGCTYPNTTINENNVMSYCQNHNTSLSPCQLGRIHRYLETNHPKWITNETCKTDDAETITITTGQNVTWNGTKHLNGNLVINAGATLTIKCDVFLKELGYIRVLPKGHLIIDGGRVTSECDDKLFFGIFVLGDENKNQSINNQGLIELKNDASIQNAIIGIRTGDFYYDYNDLSWPQFCGKTGGIVKCDNSTFRNNRKSIEFMSYHNIVPPPFNYEVDNASYFTDCTFINDNYLKGYDYGTANIWGPEFVTAWDVQGIKFDNCNFKEENNSFVPDLSLKTTAIGSYGAKYYVNNCHFDNLYAGIRAGSNFDPMDYADIKNSTLDNVQQNITTLNQFNDRIAGNIITNQPATSYQNLGGGNINSWGIYTKGSTHFKIHDNKISSNAKIGGIGSTPFGLIYMSDNNNAIITSDSYIENSIIAENTLENQTISMQTEDNNYDLQIGCNSHVGNSISWFINPISPNGFLNDQGGLSVANNNFVDGCNSQSLKNQIRSEVAFSYNDNLGSFGVPDVNCVTPNVLLVTGAGGSTSNCNQYIPIIAPNSNGTIGIENIDLHGLNEFEKQTLLLHYTSLFSEKGEIGKVISTLEMLNTVEAGKLLVSLYYSLSNGNKANEWLDKVKLPDYLQKDVINPALKIPYPQSKFNEDKNDFIKLYDILLNAQSNRRTIMNLTNEEYNALNLLSNKETRGGYMANSILTFTHKKDKNLRPEVPVQSNNKLNNSINNNLSDNNIMAYPNPFEKSFTISLDKITEENNVIIITDLIGNKIAEYPFTNNSTKLNIDTKNWISGFYFATLYINAAKSETIKLIKE